ncbi:aminoglycoside 3-N-acetyltransferase [Alloyangia pacifica]|uniref:Aminoglycoside N(3)-acetyltransferase n=2 Tax=Alloyangia pacifica TaxID=311180 RepID=A0A1I6UN59_9RHOB|nr:aminoglycoside 3-N-acetyltransferase [Alloyangia pacifica]SFT02906.1 aminoglycoside 3-N-acetyltransferase [Alloyangia pacifica]
MARPVFFCARAQALARRAWGCHRPGMTRPETDRSHTREMLLHDLRQMGVHPGDGLFVHASMRAIGPVTGGAGAVVEALLGAVGPEGLVAMPGFSSEAYFPSELSREALSAGAVAGIESAVPGFDPQRSPADGMGVIAETFRLWPGTLRSDHPAVSVCLNGCDAAGYRAPHALAWACGPGTPLDHLRARPGMKLLLIGVDWTRCSALHTAETLAAHRRTKLRRFKTGPGDAPWCETPDVADDMGRLFPGAGAALEATGAVRKALLGQAQCRLCGYAELIDFAAGWIDAANAASGARD